MNTRQRIEAYLADNPGATYRRIMADLNIKSTSTVFYHLDRIKHPPLRERAIILRQENEKFREALRLIASCQSYHKDDVVAIARKALEGKND